MNSKLVGMSVSEMAEYRPPKRIRVERKGSGEGEKMTAKGGPFMVDIEVDYFFRLSAKSPKRCPDCPNRVHPFPDAGTPSDC